MSNDELRREVLTRLYHAHPQGLGKEVLDNYRGEKAVADMLQTLQKEGLIHDGSVSVDADNAVSITYPIKLSSSGADEAKRLEKEIEG